MPQQTKTQSWNVKAQKHMLSLLPKSIRCGLSQEWSCLKMEWEFEQLYVNYLVTNGVITSFPEA